MAAGLCSCPAALCKRGEFLCHGTLIFIRCRTSPPLGTDTDVSHSLPSHIQSVSERPGVSTQTLSLVLSFSELFLRASSPHCSCCSTAPGSLRNQMLWAPFFYTRYLLMLRFILGGVFRAYPSILNPLLNFRSR